MKFSHEVVVRAGDLADAARWVNRGKRAQAEETHLYQAQDGFVVETPRAATRVLFTGVWKSTVVVNAGTLARPVRAFPKQQELTLTFVGSRLYVERTSIPAREMADKAQA